MRRYAEPFAPAIGQACRIGPIGPSIGATMPRGIGHHACDPSLFRLDPSASNILRRTSRWRWLAWSTTASRIARPNGAVSPSIHGNEKLMTLV